MPEDYAPQAIVDPKPALMELISAHGGAEYDDKYPDGIPTSIEITTTGEVFDSLSAVSLWSCSEHHRRSWGILGEKMRRMEIALASPVVDRFGVGSWTAALARCIISPSWTGGHE